MMKKTEVEESDAQQTATSLGKVGPAKVPRPYGEGGLKFIDSCREGVVRTNELLSETLKVAK